MTVGRSFRLGRRTLLQGLGALLPLPMLEAMVAPRHSAAAEDQGLRWGIFYFPHGGFDGDWIVPAGGAVQLPAFLQPALGGIVDDLVWINRLDNQQPGFGDHETAAGTFLNCAPMIEAGPVLEKSADQIVATQIGSNGYRFPSLVTSAPGFQPAASCCHHVEICLNNISWLGGTTPATKTQDPRVLFDMIFLQDPTEEGAAAAALRLAQRKSILDFADGQGVRLQTKLGAADKQRLEDYLESIREVERRIEMNGGLPDACNEPAAPGTEVSFEDHNQLMIDMIFLAFQCDLTPVATFMMDFEFSDRLVSIPNVSGGHHTVSHHEGSQANIDQLRLYGAWYAARFAGLVERMKTAVDLNGQPMLDNSIMMLCSGINDGNAHARLDVPVVLAGKAGGVITPGRAFDADRPLADLHRTIMSVMGCDGPEVDEFGDTTGMIDELLA